MRKVMKWLGVGTGAMAGLAVLAYAAVYVMSEQRIRATHAVNLPELVIPDDSASITLGRHMARAIGKCVDCHGQKFEGTVFLEDPLLGRISAPNLTSSGVVQGYTDADWVRSIRHGVKRDGRSVNVMPSYEYYNFSDTDLAALIAYLKSLPPVDNTPPALRYGPMGRLLIAGNVFPVLAAEAVDHTAPRPEAPAVGPTPEYGRYISSIGCAGCHGATLQGGAPPAEGPDITASGRIAGWTEEDFRVALRAGKRPDGTVIDLAMPWNMTSEMTDTEIAAVWAYIQSIGPAPRTAQRAH
jgi:mono/diheme cytochrome c family protein